MTALEKLNALQAGELIKLTGQQFQLIGKAPFTVEDLRNAAKVEVTKVMLDEARMLLNDNLGRRHSDLVVAARQALTLLQQLKESL
jgi:hypothetical protein